MMKKAQLSEDIIKKLKELEGEELCELCMFSVDCPRSTQCYGGNVVYTPCAEDSYEDYIDVDLVNEKEW